MKRTVLLLSLLGAFGLGGCVTKIVTVPLDIATDVAGEAVDIVTP